MASPASLTDKLAIIQLNVTRLAQAARTNPAVLGPVHEDVTEMYLLSVGAAEYVDQQTEQAAALAASVAVAS